MMTYDEAIKYIHGISWSFCKPGLERIGALCEALGNPEDKLRFIHVAGTNGKGSFCSMLSSVLSAAGYKTGLYTSPYIKVFNERMQIDGKSIEDSELAELTELVRPIADKMADKPTEFELITAIAFLYFAKEGCDVVVLEAGMGGRLDSTNVIKNPLLSVITGIALDHTAYLGDTVEKIAKEKAGIIKQGSPVLFGGEDICAEAVIKSEAEKCRSEFFLVDRRELSVRSAELSGTVFDYRHRQNLNIKLLGLYQPKNAASVLDAVDILKNRGLNISEEALRFGLLSARWPARFEIISKAPLIIFDGAHNPEGVSVATESIAHYFKEKVTVISGVLQDKDYRFIAGKISEIADTVYTITPDSPRALSAPEYSKILSERGVDATPYPNIKSALSKAWQTAEKNQKPIVCLGSLYTYAELTAVLDEIKSQNK